MITDSKELQTLKEKLKKLKSFNTPLSKESISDLIDCMDQLEDYVNLEKCQRLLKTNVPLGSILYLCLIQIDENGQIPYYTIEQKAFVPGTVYFDALNNNYGTVVFDNVVDAIKCINDKVGIDTCKNDIFMTIDDDGFIHDNGSTLLKEFAVYDKRLNDEFFKNVIHTELVEEVIDDNLNDCENTESED